MEVKLRYWNKISPEDKNMIFSRSELNVDSVKDNVQNIINKVKKDGDQALFKYTEEFDGVKINKSNIKVSEAEFNKAKKLLTNDVKEALKYSIENVKNFHKSQKIHNEEMFEIRPGIMVGEKISAIESAGLYVPHGRGNFPSMLYMLAIPAVIAGVKHISIVSPPSKDGSIDPGCLYAAELCGIKDIYKVGGAQAIAALTYGTESINKVVKILGPGSMYVTAAKRLLYGTVDVGLPAGPSESMVLADESADSFKVALDLMIEAEHGSDSSAILVTPSETLAKDVKIQIEKLAEDLTEPRKTFIKDVFSGYGGIIITEDIITASKVVNEFAPEHLQIQTASPKNTMKLIKNAGEILLGENTPFSIANYATGPNAVLPTGGTAKTFSAVSVRDFIKYSSVIETNETGLKNLKKHVEVLCDYEGFICHGNALKLRK